MIIGHGDIASALKEFDRPDRIYFASGVSNSQLRFPDPEYDREIRLLADITDAYRTTHLVYFSSLCVFYSNTDYAQFKREQESRVENYCDGAWTIIRLGNINWGNNPHTLINSIRNKIKNHEPFEIQDVYRYVVDKEEFLHWIDLIPPWACEMNIVGRRMKVKDIVKEYCYPWGEYHGTSEHSNTIKELQVCFQDSR